MRKHDLKLRALGAVAAMAFLAPAVALAAPVAVPSGYQYSLPLPSVTIGQDLQASGVAAVTSAIASATQSSTFTPLAGRPFNVQLSGTFVATCQLERQINAVWAPLTVSASGSIVQVYLWSAPASEIVVESQAAVPYRVNCTSYTSGTVNVSLSQ